MYNKKELNVLISVRSWYEFKKIFEYSNYSSIKYISIISTNYAKFPRVKGWQ